MGKPRKKTNSNIDKISKADIYKKVNRAERKEARQFLKEGSGLLTSNPESYDDQLYGLDKLEKCKKFSACSIHFQD